MTVGRISERPGLQAQRTELSWDRSAAGLMASGALLMFRPNEPITVGRAVLATAAVLLALLAVRFGWNRGRAARVPRRRDGASFVPDARRQVLVIGGSVVALATGTVLILVVS